MTRLPAFSKQVLADLAAEGDALEAMVAPLDESGWRTPTPAAGWDVATQVAHLAWTDEVAAAAATDKEQWDAIVTAGMADPTGFVDDQALERRPGPARRAAGPLARGPPGAAGGPARHCPTGQKMPWFGPPMSPTSMATARFMETWAHALDVADALGIEPEPTDRIRHVAHLGVRTRNFSFGVQLRSSRRPRSSGSSCARPSGELWEWGPADAAQSVRGLGVRLLPAGHPAPPPRRPRPGRRRPRRRPLARHRPGLRRPARPRPPAVRATTVVEERGTSVSKPGDARQGPRASATAAASTATASPPCASCSRAARSTSSPATTSPS